jgi:hypothetical protein
MIRAAQRMQILGHRGKPSSSFKEWLIAFRYYALHALSNNPVSILLFDHACLVFLVDKNRRLILTVFDLINRSNEISITTQIKILL